MAHHRDDHVAPEQSDMLVALELESERAQLVSGLRVKGFEVGHRAPPRTEGESSPVFSPIFGTVLRFLVPLRSLRVASAASGGRHKVPISSAFPRACAGGGK